MTTEEKLKEACEILNTLRIDAEMAICGDWNKSDDGFQDQIDNITYFLNKIGYDYENYKDEEEYIPIDWQKEIKTFLDKTQNS